MSGVINVLLGGTGPFSVSASPLTLYGFRNGKGTAETGSSVTCSTLNGTPPFSFTWNRVSGSALIYPYTGSLETTKFAAYMANPYTVYSAVWRCTVIDSNLNTVYTSNIDVTLERFT